MEDSATGKVINADVPLAEMFGYATDLRSATQGRATYTMEFKQYAEVPSNIADSIIDNTASWFQLNGVNIICVGLILAGDDPTIWELNNSNFV